MAIYPFFASLSWSIFDRTSIFVALASLTIVAVRLIKKPRRLPFPPGPRPLPLIANALDFPLARPWETYTRWGQQYGDITHIKVLGMHIYVLNSAEATGDLLDGRSNLYSSRPDMPVAELTGWHMTMATLPYGDMWRKHRALYHNKFKQESVHQFIPLLTCKAHVLLRQLLATPDERVEHIRNYPAASLMYICYGHTIESHHDPLVEISETAAQEVAETILKGSLVNMLPMARHLPDWFGFQRSARECRRKVNLMLNVPYESVRRHMTSGNTVPSWMSEMLDVNDSKGGDKAEEEIIKSVTASSFAGKTVPPFRNPACANDYTSTAANDTTASALQFFVLAMLLYPEVQRKAQEELDRVVGLGNIPTFEDRESLPYIDAIFRELLRWRPPAAIGVPHSSTKDDIYRDYYIPKGSIIFANIWGMSHDSSVYPNPEAFQPERFLNPDGTLNDNDKPFAFGFGRRVCVGSAFAREIIWIAIATMLSVFQFDKAKTPEGNDIEVDGGFSDSLVMFVPPPLFDRTRLNFVLLLLSHPLEFKCLIKPRSQACEEAILKTPELKLDSLELRWFE
ncbi:hypothetical protein CCMSSC00406_0005891 [Pleurotus cornucopiae]|uniref:Uncharacterized protein n=1 Tax=Pleurotus cornucopiae TaxID=5321 RepID=A0ACB7IJE1_PLECO|nr:hypothetical protein CCMSSC00406_0005891 [Pleurotus cornucopiae]